METLRAIRLQPVDTGRINDLHYAFTVATNSGVGMAMYEPLSRRRAWYNIGDLRIEKLPTEGRRSSNESSSAVASSSDAQILYDRDWLRARLHADLQMEIGKRKYTEESLARFMDLCNTACTEHHFDRAEIASLAVRFQPARLRASREFLSIETFLCGTRCPKFRLV